MPEDYAFVPGDQGVHTFSAILNKPGSFSLSASGIANGGPAIIGTSSAIAARGLLVTEITPTLSGFTALFSKPFDISPLNLYDAFAALGPADVQLALNAVQTITFSSSLTNNSTFTLAFQGNTTAPITYVNTSATALQANIQSALNALPILGSGNTLVTALSSSSFSVTFQNVWGFQPIALLSANPGLPTIAVSTSTAGSSALRGTVALDSDNQGLTWIRSGTASNGLLRPGNYRVTMRAGANGFHEPDGTVLDGNSDGVTGDNFTAIFTVAAAPTTILSIPDFARGPDTAYNARIPNNAGQETQTITFNGTSHGSTFTLAFAGATTSSITYSTLASVLQANIQAAMESLSTIDSSRRPGIQVTVPNSTSAAVLFQNLMGGFDQPQMTSGSPTVSVSTTTQGINTGIPVTLAGAAGVTDVTFDLVYDPAFLAIGGAYSMVDGSSLTLDGPPTDGVASFHYSLGAAAPLGASATLGHIIAHVPDSAANSYKSKHILRLQNIVANFGAVNMVGNDAVHAVAYMGDTSGDGVNSGGDAGLICALESASTMVLRAATSWAASAPMPCSIPTSWAT